MTTMLEKMAGSIMGVVGFRHRVDCRKSLGLAAARAALQTIRDLDDTTLRAGMAASWAQPEALREAHRAIIDAILNEEP